MEGEDGGQVEVFVCIVLLGYCIDGSVSIADDVTGLLCVCMLCWFLGFVAWILWIFLFCVIGNYN